MKRVADWSDGNYMEWADQERLVRQDIEELKRIRNKEIREDVEKNLSGISSDKKRTPSNSEQQGVRKKHFG